MSLPKAVVNEWGIMNYGKSYSELVTDLSDIDDLRADNERLREERDALREQSLRTHRLICKTHKHSPTLGDIECPLCGRFIPDLNALVAEVERLREEKDDEAWAWGVGYGHGYEDGQANTRVEGDGLREAAQDVIDASRLIDNGPHYRVLGAEFRLLRDVLRGGSEDD